MVAVNEVYSGIHPTARGNIDSYFSEKESKIAARWSEYFYITSAGRRQAGTSEFKFFLVKPTSTVEEALGISKEIVVILSPYESFEARTLEAYDSITSEITDQRCEKMCYALISHDKRIEKVLPTFLSNQENQIVIPFSYYSFEEHKNDPNYIKNQFRKYFYSRDLFDYSEPLKKDTFFFGRSDVVTNIIAKHRAGLNYGVFGLRKTGKTSIIYDVERKSVQQQFTSVIVDCQNTSFNMRSWNSALYYVVLLIKEKIGYPEEIQESEFDKTNASLKFEYYLKKFKSISSKTLLLLFDEIENITFGKSSVRHWCEGLDFVYFWQSIRSAFQTTADLFTFCIFGTNAKCVEDATILGKDNPIFNMFQPFYIEGFDVPQTREMVRKLGRIMGIKFEETIYTHLVEDYGGHPFLIRRVCSKIAQMNPNRPVTIDRSKYAAAKNKFNLENNYFDMILQVLKQFYPDEYEMLKMLAYDDMDSFNYFVNADRSMINHLIGYGLISQNDRNYDFKIDAIKDYILRIESTSRVGAMSSADKWSFLCTERNTIEIELRKLVRAIIKIAYKNESSAKEYVVKKIYANDRKYNAFTYNDLFDSRASNIYLKNLIDLMNANWEYFVDYFGKQDIFIANANVLNSEGRFDAHATIPDEDEINTVGNSTRYFKKGIEKYKKSLE